MDETLDMAELCLVHRSAAFALPKALPETGVDMPSIISVRLEDLRLCHAIMRRAESIEKRLMRICSNEMCTRHAMSGPLKRCPCGLAYYCSRSCQKADWRAQGRHRNECGLHAQYDLKISSRDWSHLNSLAVALVFDCRGEIFGHTRAVPLQDNILLDLDLRECGMMYISLSVHYAGYELQSIIMPPFEDISEIRDADIDQLDSAEKQWWDRGGHYIRESVEDKHDTPT
ncbi:hypothetical protein BD626DRAFT_477647 [Schizophyllum amplum]|uniref:MYND-type domain-containing protein n=1 Tax=Schizophyllum amplum TaxID=97359 RepID=A0A550D0E0_9AGAR|nr:hypothetical protein BD626DRAFT_477647 [Auriculariopsis ampla]